jgi:hypothetical protein
MNEPQLPAWETDELSAFLSTAQRNERVTALKMPDVYALLRHVHDVFVQVAAITEKEHTEKLLLPRLLMARARGAWLAAVRDGMSGQVVEAYPAIRAVIENSWYAFHLAKDPAPPARAEIWLRRHDSDAATDECKGEFTIGRVSRTHREFDADNEAVFHGLYAQAIDYGGHPNERGVLSAMTSRDTDEGRTYQVALITHDLVTIAVALKTAIEAAIGALKIFRLIFFERFRIMGIEGEIEKLVGGLNTVFKAYVPRG